MKRYYFLICTFLLIFLPIKVKAYYYCPSDIKINLQKLASNVNSYYEVIETSDKATFEITLYNVHNSLFIRNALDESVYYPDTTQEMSEIKIRTDNAGTTYRFEVYPTLQDCSEQSLALVYVTLPPYNPYYRREECKKSPEFKYCKKWDYPPSSEKQFLSALEEYLREDTDVPKTDEEEDKSKLEQLWDFIVSNYYFYVPAAFGMVALVFIFIYMYKQKKDDVGF